MDTPSALIGRVAAREPDREHLRVKRAGGRLDLSARLALGEPIDTAPLLDELHQLRALIAAAGAADRVHPDARGSLARSDPLASQPRLKRALGLYADVVAPDDEDVRALTVGHAVPLVRNLW
jgi:hypothetical protein